MARVKVIDGLYWEMMVEADYTGRRNPHPVNATYRITSSELEGWESWRDENMFIPSYQCVGTSSCDVIQRLLFYICGMSSVVLSLHVDKRLSTLTHINLAFGQLRRRPLSGSRLCQPLACKITSRVHE